MDKEDFEKMTPTEREFYNKILGELSELKEAFNIADFEDNIDYEEAYLYYKTKYEAIRDATFWRMTRPLRKLVDYYQWRRTGVRIVADPAGDEKNNINEKSFSFNKDYKHLEQYFKYNKKSLTDLLQKQYDVITFDVFDTMISRLIYEPDDVFHFMERKIQSTYHKRVDYLSIRKKAEVIAWEEKGDACNIHHIYNKLPEVSDFTREDAEALKQMEIDLEYELCIPRRDVLDIFNHLITVGKKIILISDMYLPGVIIDKMLKKCGYQGYEELWVSCDKGRRKDKGTMWEEFLERFGQYPTIHIGDNPHSDGQMLENCGREYVLLLSSMEAFRSSIQYNKLGGFSSTTVENSLVLGYLINQCLYNSPFSLTRDGISKVSTIEGMSSGILAPIIVKFIEYLQATSCSDTEFLFLSREGFFLEKVYEKYCHAFHKPERKHTYFLTSRRATSVAQIESYEDLKELFQTKYSGKLSALLKERVGLENVSVKKSLDVTLPDDMSKVMRILLDYIPEILNNANQEKEMYLRYIRQTIGEDVNWDRITLVDVGYSGTIQYYLMKILKKRLNGCYMISRYTMKPERLDGTYRSLYNYKRFFKSTQLFLEAVTAAPHGQVVKFYEEQGKIKAQLKQEEKNYNKKIEEIQECIYSYVETMGNLLKDIKPRFDKELAECIFSEILREGLLDSSLQGVFSVDDGYCMDGNWVFDESRHEWVLRRDE
ncbi:hypothetical protein [Lacrimispora brassicae]